MQWLTWAFLIAVTAETLTRLWLGFRQVAAVQAHRNEVPEPFRGQVALAISKRRPTTPPRESASAGAPPWSRRW
jgi:hypothetical protein